MKELNWFEKLIPGYKTYALAILTVVYGVLLQGYHLHHWTTLGGAWSWVIGGGALSVGRAAWAEFQVLIAEHLASKVIPTVTSPQTGTLPKV